MSDADEPDRLGLPVPSLVGVVGLLSTILSTVVLYFGAPPMVRVLREIGVLLPVTTELGLSLLLDWGHLVGLGLLASGVVAGRVPRKLGLALLALVVAASGFVLLLGVGGFLAARAELTRFGGPTPPPAYAPGRAAEVGERVVEAVRRCLPRARSFQAPGGQTRWFFLYDGPGAPPAPEADASYEEVHAHDACVLLPAAAVEGNTEIDREPLAFAPRWLDLSPGTLRASEQRTLEPDAFMSTTADGSRAFRFRRVFDAGDGFAYSLMLQRVRLSTSGSPRIGAVDPYSDSLFQVRVLVFAGFDAGRAEDSTIPDTNVPARELVTQVRR